MSKRSGSKFERPPRDFYPTPFAAVPPLIPHLRGVRSFAEMCAGDGALVRHLESFGLRCVYQGDIEDGQDVFACTSFNGAQVGITNPPYGDPDKPKSRKQMAAIIRHCMGIAPSWFLLEADWCQTKQALPLMAMCSDIVAIGRVRWIEGTKGAGYDNSAWCRFDARHVAGPIFHPYRSAPVSSRATVCAQCGVPYRPQRLSSRFCSDTCRQRAHRSRLLSVT
jgi:hypothetical protein